MGTPRIKNSNIVYRVVCKKRIDEITINDIESAYFDLRTEAHGDDSWARFGAAVRGGALKNGLRADRIAAIEDEIASIAERSLRVREALAYKPEPRSTVRIAFTRDEARALAATLSDWSVDLSADLAEKLRARIAGELSRC